MVVVVVVAGGGGWRVAGGGFRRTWARARACALSFPLSSRPLFERVGDLWKLVKGGVDLGQ